MNCPSRVNPAHMDGWNQNPDSLNADATTRADLGEMANARLRRDSSEMGELQQLQIEEGGKDNDNEGNNNGSEEGKGVGGAGVTENGTLAAAAEGGDGGRKDGGLGKRPTPAMVRFGKKAWHIGAKYLSFIGPGFMVAVAYIDPGNYATDVAAGASYRFRLLFIILMSNIFAIFLQSLCIKLGSVTGMNLAENCRAHLPPWLNYVLYAFAESAIIATDMAEVIGTAIALNVLLKIPLVAGCAISIVDVLIILFFYRPSGSIRALRAFEFFVMALVLGVVICFCFQLSLIENTSVGEVFRGYLPSSAIVESQGLFQSCGILGATVMPHSLYLGSGIVQARLRDFDKNEGNLSDLGTTESHDTTRDDRDTEFAKYRPSLAAIRSCMTYSIVELAVSLFTFALFVNSAILIVAGASLYNVDGSDNADLFTIHDLLSKSLAPAAGTIFALALLLSGTSAGIVCTIAGQMVSEGQLNWTVKPWVRRLMTRSISITPSIIIAGAVGRHGLSRALEGSQVALSVILPFTSAPLIWFTCRSQYMKVSVGAGGVDEGSGEDAERDSPRDVQMRNHWITASFAVVIWAVIVVMNIALLVLVGKGVA
ncbi:natural resistance-associated macrophage protein [Mytilinidion resinicola]|uniref:Natural resistance-associated macrophage protein n=1 Tax=Mytilinidion resinicola TaxID=574789 RepID=A0A6A6YVQ1_9PEZI|nr:natural resistance-associated macrophage protein [Mytilinidion resinicola]KAF2812599.1 natural resistance-associated macrophage protein [Mytilinidion resinicola]